MTTTTDPISLAQAQRLAANADTILLRATRSADLETPIGAFLRLDDGGPAYLLESVEGGERLGRYSFLGVGPRRLLEVRDGLARTQTRPVTVPVYAADLPVETAPAADPLAAIRGFVPRRRVAPTEGMPRFTGGAVGALSYDAVSAFEPTVPRPDRDPVGVPTAAFIETDLVLVFDHLTHTLSAIASLHTERPDLEGRYRIAEEAIFAALERTSRPSLAEMNGSRPRPAGPGADVSTNGSGPSSGSLRQTERRPTATDRAHRVSTARFRRVSAATPTSMPSRSPRTPSLPARRSRSCWPAASPSLFRRTPRPASALDGIALYRSLRRINPSPYLFFVRTPGFEVVGASPELLLQVEGDRLTTHPIAGTRPRGADAREDALLAEELQRDPKERAEHVMLVDLGRNDIGRVSRPGTVTVSKYMEVERYSHVLHLVSHVEGKLKPDLDALDALRAVFPAGTLSGAPKVRAMQLIAAAEGECRGLYGGAVGYLGYDGNLDTAITIRSAVLKDGQAHVHTGAGIVAGSVPETRVRGDRAQGRCAPPGDRAGGRRAREAPRVAAAAAVRAGVEP